MKLIDLKCPSCNAQMRINSDLKRVICVYCGKEMLLDDEVRPMKITNGFDYGYEYEKGRLKAQAEFQKQQMLKEQKEQREIEEKRLEEHERFLADMKKEEAEKRKRWYGWLACSFIIAAIGVVAIVMAGLDSPVGIGGIFMVIIGVGMGSSAHSIVFVKEPTDYNSDSDFVVFPKGMEPFNLLDFEEALGKLKDAGFTNITCRNLHDVKLGILTPEGKVQGITVSGKQVHSGGDWYPKYIPIVISYHGR